MDLRSFLLETENWAPWALCTLWLSCASRMGESPSASLKQTFHGDEDTLSNS